MNSATGFFYSIAIICLCIFRSLPIVCAQEQLIVVHPDINVTYSVDRPSCSITFTLSGKIGEWVGVGFNENRDSMAGADLFMGSYSFTKPPQVYKDFYVEETEGNHTPIEDEQQDWEFMSSRTIGNYFNLTVSRKLNTCDKLHDIVIPNRDIHFLWATSNSTDFTQPPTVWGSLQLNLLQRFGCQWDHEDDDIACRPTTVTEDPSTTEASTVTISSTEGSTTSTTDASTVTILSTEGPTTSTTEQELVSSSSSSGTSTASSTSTTSVSENEETSTAGSTSTSTTEGTTFSQTEASSASTTENLCPWVSTTPEDKETTTTTPGRSSTDNNPVSLSTGATSDFTKTTEESSPTGNSSATTETPQSTTEGNSKGAGNIITGSFKINLIVATSLILIYFHLECE